MSGQPMTFAERVSVHIHLQFCYGLQLSRMGEGGYFFFTKAGAPYIAK